MTKDELVIRAVHAAKYAREKGFTNTADAFDEIVRSLLETYQIRSITSSKETLKASFEIDYIN